MLKLPTLQVSRRVAKAHIGERIKEGRRASMESYETSSKRAERRYAAWDRRNYQALIQLFDSDETISRRLERLFPNSLQKQFPPSTRLIYFAAAFMQ